MDTFRRWPLLLAAVTLTAVAIGVDVSAAAGERLAVALLVLAATTWGAYVYAEGARHREWWAASDDDDEGQTP